MRHAVLLPNYRLHIFKYLGKCLHTLSNSVMGRNCADPHLFSRIDTSFALWSEDAGLLWRDQFVVDSAPANAPSEQ